MGKNPSTNAGERYFDQLRLWLQQVRLVSAAVHLAENADAEAIIRSLTPSWPDPPDTFEYDNFRLRPGQVPDLIESMRAEVWAKWFVFLESLWEEYLQNLVLEVSTRDAKIVAGFCGEKWLKEATRKLLAGEIATTDEFLQEAATMFASGLTRDPWEEQWKSLGSIGVGMNIQKDKQLEWFDKLDEYFEIRNCIIHNGKRVSRRLRDKSSYYASRTEIVIYPVHLEHYREHFKSCVNEIESRLDARRLSEETPASGTKHQPKTGKNTVAIRKQASTGAPAKGVSASGTTRRSSRGSNGR